MHMTRTIDWDGEAVAIIDQTLLPHEERVVCLREVGELTEAIRTMRVRRAQELGEDVRQAVERAAIALASTRPTAVNLRWGIGQASRAAGQGPEAIVEAAVSVLEADVKTNRRMAERGADWLESLRHPGRLRVLTHCNTGALACVEIGTALGVIQLAHRRGLVKEVIATA